MMTPKQRFLTAMQNGVPDRVPGAPDISNNIPRKRTGLPFWDIYFFGQIPLVDMLCDETDVNCINPREIAPMGDVALAEVKRARGRQITLMGNLHTTNVMLRGTLDDVRRAARQAIAGAGGIRCGIRRNSATVEKRGRRQGSGIR